MKKTKLHWFDQLMLDVTFAEAGVTGPGNSPKTRKGVREDQFFTEQVKEYNIQDGCTTATV